MSTEIKTNPAGKKSFLKSNATRFLFLAILFTLSFNIKMLYEDNQNTKFLHGMAGAGIGYLDKDWLANTIDPLPVFSWFIKFIFTFFPGFITYFFQFILYCIYLYSILGIVSHLFKIEIFSARYMFLSFFILLLHSRVLSEFSLFIFDGGDFFEFLYNGVAWQSIIYRYLQPSTFGVLLFLSAYLFLKKRHFLSILCIGGTCLIHSAYLLLGGLMVAVYMFLVFIEEKKIIKPLLMGALALAMVMPVLLYNLFYLDSTSASLNHLAQDIIVNKRIPHHSVPTQWLDQPMPYIQLVIMACAFIVIRKTRFVLVLLVPFAIALICTVVELFINNLTLASLAPWRNTVLITPLCTFILIGYGVSKIIREKTLNAVPRYKTALFLVILVLFTGGSVFFQVMDYLNFRKSREINMLNFVKETKTEDAVYLIPPYESALNQFRLYTGAAVFVNWKSHPYKDTEVVEWYNRVLYAKAIYEQEGTLPCNLLDDLCAKHHITHLVFRSQTAVTDCTLLKRVYTDDHYSVYRIMK